MLPVAILLAIDVQAASYAKIFKKVDPAVVVIYTRENVVVAGAEGITQTAQEGLGSGVVIATDGLIMTAAHVVGLSDKIAVVFSDGKKYFAQVVSSSTVADVALIKLERLPDQLAVAKLGDSDKIDIGDEVFVIGAPYGIEHTLTAGYLSGRHEESLVDRQLGVVEFLQTDAAINKGNSGGPLFNSKGEVIAIVSHIKSATGGSEGLGFATPVNLARKLLLEERSIWAGLEAILIDKDLAAALNIPDSGLLVQRVAKKSLGDLLGLKGGRIPITINDRKILIGGDVIVSLAGITLKEVEDVRKARDKLVKLPYGSRIDVEVLRAGKMKAMHTTKRKTP